jgi:Putative Ig domain
MKQILHVLAAALFFSWVGLAEPATPFEGSPPKTHTETVSTGKAEYTVNVSGVLDMDNTMTRECSNRHIAFQNNLSLTIANTGTVPVTNPRIITNGLRRWGSIDELVAEFTAGAENDQDRIYLIWENMRLNRHHDDPLYGDNEFHDPVRWLNVYGGGLCDDAGACGSALFHAAGFTAARVGEDPFVRCLRGHMQCEVFLDGDFQFIDIDENLFFLDRENNKPVSGDVLARDHDLAKRELPYGPIQGSWDTSHRNAALFGVDDGRTGYGKTGHRMDYVLRPGERMVFRWDNVGKYAWANTSDSHRYFGNSRIVYEPGSVAEGVAFAADTMDGCRADGNAMVCDADAATAVISNTTCYAICGGTVSADFTGGTADTEYSVASSVDGKAYTVAWEGKGTSAHAEAVLDEALGIHGGPPCRTHYVRFALTNGKGASISNIRIKTDITASPMALPRLNVGANTVEYTDATEGPHEVTVTHEWTECGNVALPVPPEQPVSPKPGEVVGETYPVFRWPAVEGCDAYWIRVSRRSDMAYPYRPNYDLVVPANEHSVPWRGMFSPDETYYWRVRPRLASGVWGAWSPVWTFRWDGPMVPREIAHRSEDDTLALTWQPNPNGTRPVRYDVYGSDERGFSVNRDPHTLPVLGEVPGNFVGSTTEAEMTIVSPEGGAANMNRAYYRVVAVDADGVESCPSDFAEMPRPYVFTKPVETAAVGQPYRYQMVTLQSIGDLQSRYVEPRQGYREKEAYGFTLEAGPAWLKLDEKTGLLSGTPAASDAGETAVKVRVSVSYPDEVPPDSKVGPEFQKRRTRPDLQRECLHQFTLKTEG